MQVTRAAPKSPATILARLFETGRGEMTRELARHILKLRLSLKCTATRKNRCRRG
jgi:hypothetical protein